MEPRLSEQLEAYIRQAGLSLREIAGLCGIPHQTLFNWLKGSQPRWHTALPANLQRLGIAMGLAEDDIALLFRLAGCTAARLDVVDLDVTTTDILEEIAPYFPNNLDFED